MSIPPELTELIATKPFYREGLRQVGAMLPESDEELHEWLMDAGSRTDANTLHVVTASAAMVNRRLRASLLPLIMTFRPSPWQMAWMAWHMEGNVTEELVRGIEGAVPANLTHTLALFVAAAWWMEHRPDEELPRRILRYATELSQRANLDLNDMLVLGSLATLLGKEAEKELASAFKKDKRFVVPNQRGKQTIYRTINGPFEKLVSKQKIVGTDSKRPIRKVETPQLNERCPCGSGKKYKACCGSRVVHNGKPVSTPVVQAKVEIDPHIGLTEKRLQKMPLAEVLQLDVTQMSPELQESYLLYLGIAKQHDRLIELFAKLGAPEHLHKVWSHTWEFASEQWRPDLARKLMEVFPEAEEKLGVKANAGVRLLLVGDDPGKLLEEVKSNAERLLESGDLYELQQLAWALLESPYRALGILLARGVLPLVEEKYVDGLYDGILRARAKLDLDSNDEFSKWMNEKALRKARDHETSEVQKAHDKLVQTAEQSRRAAEEKQRLERELRLLRKRERTQQEANASHAIDEETQNKIRALMADKKNAQTLAKERGEAELEARKALEELTRENEELRAAANSSEESLEEKDEEGREDFKVTERPPRPIAFPKDFASTLSKFKQHVARAAMLRLGRMGAGEPEAFNFIKKIKAFEDVLVLEARVSERYRLLFCLLPKYIRVVGFVYRPELDKFVDHCKIAGLPPVAEFE